VSEENLFRMFIEALRLVSHNDTATCIVAAGFAVAMVLVLKRKGPPRN